MQEAVRVHEPQVAGAEVAVGREGPGGLLRLPVVPRHDHRPLRHDLAHPLRVGLADAQVEARDGQAGGVVLPVAFAVAGQDRRALGQAVALQHGDPEVAEALGDVRRQRGRPANEGPQVGPEGLEDRREQAAAQVDADPPQRVAGRERLAQPARAAVALGFAPDALVHGLEHQGDRDQERALRFPQVARDVAQPVAEGDRRAAVERPEKAAHALVGVVDRQDRQEDVPGADRDIGHGRRQVRAEVAVGQRDRLGLGGRARREEQDTHGLRVDCPVEVVAPPGLQERAAALEEPFERQSARRIGVEPHVDEAAHGPGLPGDRGHDLALGLGEDHGFSLGARQAAADLALRQLAGRPAR